jgi:hypothetical protein
MKENKLINEVAFGIHQALIRVVHKDEITASEVADFIRAMPGVTRVTAVDSDENSNMVVLKVKILTSKPGAIAFEKLKKDTFRLVPNIKKVDLSLKSIEKIE